MAIEMINMLAVLTIECYPVRVRPAPGPLVMGEAIAELILESGPPWHQFVRVSQ